jgi:hypothetical protein
MAIGDKEFLAQTFEVPVENVLDFRAEHGYATVKLCKSCDLEQISTGVYGDNVPAIDDRKLSLLFNVPAGCLRESRHSEGSVEIEIRFPFSEHGSWEEMAAVLSAQPICDGCRVNRLHEHRCHGDRSVIQGVQTNFACTCQSCTELPAI